MVPPGLEMIVGMVRDEVFGPVVVCGLGGVLTEMWPTECCSGRPSDRKLRVPPLAALRGARLLAGYRGLAARDVSAMIAAVVGLGELAAEIGDLVSELDINPLMVGGADEGCQAADALIVLSARS